MCVSGRKTSKENSVSWFWPYSQFLYYQLPHLTPVEHLRGKAQWYSRAIGPVQMFAWCVICWSKGHHDRQFFSHEKCTLIHHCPLHAWLCCPFPKSMLVCSLATQQAVRWTQHWVPPACQGYTHTVLWGGHLGWFLHQSHFPSSKDGSPDPSRLRQQASYGAAAGNGAEVPVRALGGRGKSRWRSCSTDVSVGIASIAIQQAQVWFSSLVQMRKTADEAWQLVCNPPWFLPVLNFISEPCCWGAPYWQKFMWLLSFKLAGDACGSFLSAQIKGSWTHGLGSKQSKATTDFTGSRISAPASVPDAGPLPPHLYLRPQTCRSEGLNGTMVGSYQCFLSNCSWL